MDLPRSDTETRSTYLPRPLTASETHPNRSAPKGQQPWQVTLADAQVNLAMVWSSVLDGIDNDALPAHQRAWLPQTRPLGLIEDTALIAAPNEFTKKVLESRLHPAISKALSAHLGREIRVAVTVDPTAVPTPPPTPSPYGGPREPVPGPFAPERDQGPALPDHTPPVSEPSPSPAGPVALSRPTPSTIVPATDRPSGPTACCTDAPSGLEVSARTNTPLPVACASSTAGASEPSPR